jgi:hypothetical protein
MSETSVEYGGPAIVMGLAFDMYAARRGINASAIAEGRTSMLHMRHSITGDRLATAAMKFGTLAHYVLLEGGKNLVFCDSKRGSNAWSEAVLAAGGDDRLVCKPAEFMAACAMRDKVMQNRDAARIIESTNHEVSAFWTGDYGQAKARFDMLSDTVLADYKTTGDIRPDRFFSTAERLGYHVKMGWYAEGVEKITGKRPAVRIIVQESKPPYDCFVCEMPPQTVDQGREEAIEIAMRYRAHEVTGSFPGVASDGMMIAYERPSWTLGGENAEVSMEGLME